MITAFKNNKILLLFLAFALSAAFILCSIRVFHETANSKAAFVMLKSDIDILAKERGITPEEYEHILQNSLLASALNPDDPKNELNLFLHENVMYRDRAAILGLVEDEFQLLYNPVEGFDPDSGGKIVKVFHLIPKYAGAYASLGYSGAEAIENIFYRAITDRNIRVIWLAPFTDSQSGEIISDPGVYVRAMENTAGRVKPLGVTFGSEISVFPNYSPSKLLLAVVIWGICAGAALLLNSAAALKRNICTLLCTLAAGGGSVLLAINSGLAVTLFSLLASIVGPCLAIWFMSDALMEIQPGIPCRECMSKYVYTLLVSASISLSFAMLTAALMSSTAYSLSLVVFRGVKVSQLAPVFFAAFVVLRAFFGGNGVRGITNGIFSGKKLFAAALISALTILVIYFILRTGDGYVKVSTLEQRFRNFLEEVLMARPRTKEFLFAWPCLALCSAMLAQRHKVYSWPFAILVSTGLSSVANTFCHSRSPILLSMSRTGIGLAAGLLLGLLVILIYYPLADRLSRDA